MTGWFYPQFTDAQKSDGSSLGGNRVLTQSLSNCNTMLLK